MASQEGGSNIYDDLEMGEGLPNKVERLHKVPKKLQQMTPFLKFFEPRVVSLGPYHDNVEHLEVTVDDKHKIKYCLLQDRTKKEEDFDKEMSIALKDARDLYVEDNNHNMSSEKFNDMMILNACFIIHIVDYMGNEKKTGLRIKPHLLPLVVEDIFLLENQVPFAVLEAAMKSLGENAEEMTKKFVTILNLSSQAPSGRTLLSKYFDSYWIIRGV